MQHDTEVVARAVAGDRAAFGAIYDRYARLVRAVCFDFTRDRTLAEDLCHEVFIKAHERLATLDQPDRCASWLVTIARNHGRDWTRRQQSRPNLLSGVDVDGVPGHPEQRIELDELRMAVTRLPEQERMALHLFYLAEQPAELAREILGLSRSGFYKTLDRAKQRVRSMLVESEVHS